MSVDPLSSATVVRQQTLSLNTVCTRLKSRSVTSVQYTFNIV